MQKKDKKYKELYNIILNIEELNNNKYKYKDIEIYAPNIETAISRILLLIE